MGTLVWTLPIRMFFRSPGDAGKSILIMNVHSSVGLNPPGSTTAEPFASGALYELKIDTNGVAVSDIAFRVRVTEKIHLFR